MIAGTLLGIFGVLALIIHQVTNGIILLAIAFLVSPYGIPIGGVAARQAVCDSGPGLFILIFLTKGCLEYIIGFKSHMTDGCGVPQGSMTEEADRLGE